MYYPVIQRRITKIVADKRIETGKVSTQAKAIFLTVPPCRFLIPFEATIVPAIPDERMCVVETGNFTAVEIPIVIEAVNSAIAPCA